MNRLNRLVASGAAATLAVLATTVVPATSAPGDAFDPARPLIFVSQGTPTQLATASVDENGDFAFASEGAAAPLEYNGISYNTADDYLYGFTSTAAGDIPATALVRIGEGGVVTRVGTDLFPSDGANASFQVGAFGPNGYLYAADTTGSDIFVIDVSTGTQVGASIPLSGSLDTAGQVSDWTFSQGFLWGVGDGRIMVRVDPATGDLDEWTLDADQVSAGFAGAAWTYADGSLGFSHNATGRIDRIVVTNPADASPTFALVESRNGPANGRNDGAASPGLPADLAVTKTSADFAPGGVVTYTITVTNNGAGWSTGWTIEDDVPAALSGVAANSSDADCAVAGNDVECSGGELQPGGSATVTITADVAADQTDDVENSVTVTGNEPDSDLTNNSASVVDSVDPGEEDPIVPDDPSVPAGGEGWAGPPAGLLLGLVGAVSSGALIVLRRRGLV